MYSFFDFLYIKTETCIDFAIFYAYQNLLPRFLNFKLPKAPFKNYYPWVKFNGMKKRRVCTPSPFYPIRLGNLDPHLNPLAYRRIALVCSML